MQRAVFQRENSYLKMRLEASSKIPKVFFVIHLGPAKGSKQHPYLPLTHLVQSDLLDDMVHMVEHPQQQPEPVEERSPIPGPT